MTLSVAAQHRRSRTVARGRIRFPRTLTEMERAGAVRQQTIASLHEDLQRLGHTVTDVAVLGTPVVARGARWHAIVRTEDGEELVATCRIGLRRRARYDVRSAP